jgi:hypothetical protein
MLVTLLLGYWLLQALHAPALLHTVETLMRVEDVPGSTILALAFSYATASILGAIALTIHFEYSFGGFIRRIGRTFIESTVSGLLCAGAAYATLSIFSPILPTTATLSVFLLGLAGGIAGLVTATAVYAAVGSREYAETYTALSARLWRKAEEEGVVLTTSAESQQPL